MADNSKTNDATRPAGVEDGQARRPQPTSFQFIMSAACRFLKQLHCAPRRRDGGRIAANIAKLPESWCGDDGGKAGPRCQNPTRYFFD